MKRMSMVGSERLTLTNEEMDEIKQYAPDFDCPVKAHEESVTNLFCESVCDEFKNNCPFMEMGKKLKCYEDVGPIEDFKALKEENETLKALYYDARKEGNNLLSNARAKAIDEFLHNAEEKICDRILQNQARLEFASGLAVANRILDEVAEQLKGGDV